jgi:hypothetical protein
MKKVQHGIRWQPWVFEAVKAYAKKNGMDFSETINFFVENELNHYGYFRKDYQPGLVDERIQDFEEELINIPKQKATGTGE